MQTTLLVNQTVSAAVSPVDVFENPSSATLSNIQYVSSDTTVFTVSADASNPGGAIVKGVGAGNATLTATATATEPDGTTTEVIQGVATVIVNAVPPPPPPVAAALVFTFGTPS